MKNMRALCILYSPPLDSDDAVCSAQPALLAAQAPVAPGIRKALTETPEDQRKQGEGSMAVHFSSGSGNRRTDGRCSGLFPCILLGFLICVLGPAPAAHAGCYLMSAHGSESYGVDRTSVTAYCQGHCGHCHEQHASIDGSEPAPGSGSPSSFGLFAGSFTDQATVF